MKKELALKLSQIDYIKDALSMYIEYLRDGDEDEKELAKRVEDTYDEIIK